MKVFLAIVAAAAMFAWFVAKALKTIDDADWSWEDDSLDLANSEPFWLDADDEAVKAYLDGRT